MKVFCPKCFLMLAFLGLVSCFTPKAEQDALEKRPAVEKKEDDTVRSEAAGTTSYPPSSSSIAPTRENPDMMDDEASSNVLPGDLRGSLRSPGLPETLPLSIDGKINRD